MTEHLDPFALLGVTIQSSPDDAKSAFRSLALLVHPDKQQGGGSPEQMKELLKAYKFVMQQLSLVNRENTVENLERDFAEFCKAQKEADLDIRSRELREIIMGEEEANNLEKEEKFRQRFNEAFEDKIRQQKIEDEEGDAHDSVAEDQLIHEANVPISKQKGYGKYMVKSEYSDPLAAYKIPEYKDTVDIEPPLSPIESSLSGSSQQKRGTVDPGMNTRALIQSSTIQGQLGRFFGNVKPGTNQFASDLGEAFGAHDPIAPIPAEEMTGTLEERIARMEQERKAMDEAVMPPEPVQILGAKKRKNEEECVAEGDASEAKVVKSNRFSNLFSFLW